MTSRALRPVLELAARVRLLAAHAVSGAAGIGRAGVRRLPGHHDEPSSSGRAGHEVPDDTWTVARLRAEARARGIPGTARMRKAELLEALR